LPTRWQSVSKLVFWSEKGVDRERLLSEILRALEDEGWSYSTDTGWKNWDAQIYGSFWWGVRLNSVTEYHGGPKCLTRVSLKTSMVATTLLVNFILLAILAYHRFFTENPSLWLPILYAFFVAILFSRAWRLKRRIAELVEAAAQRIDLHRVLRGKKPEPEKSETEEPESEK
jgi:O-antigen biosynthesis protein